MGLIKFFFKTVDRSRAERERQLANRFNDTQDRHLREVLPLIESAYRDMDGKGYFTQEEWAIICAYISEGRKYCLYSLDCFSNSSFVDRERINRGFQLVYFFNEYFFMVLDKEIEKSSSKNSQLTRDSEDITVDQTLGIKSFAALCALHVLDEKILTPYIPYPDLNIIK